MVCTMTKIVESDSTGDTQGFQSLLSQAVQSKGEMNILYEMYKNKRNEYDSLRSQIEETLSNERQYNDKQTT